MFRKAYRKLMKIMLAYCRHPKAKPTAILDLARGYRYYSFIDMTEVRLFFLFEVPYKFPVDKAKELLVVQLERIRLTNTMIPPNQQQAMSPQELNCQMFELVCVPILTKHMDSEIIFDESMLKLIMEVFFGIINIQ